MAYTDGIVQYEGAPTAENAAAADINRADMATPDIRFPGGATILGFGIQSTGTAAYSANATRPAVSLSTATSCNTDASYTEQAVVTITASLAKGARIRSSASVFPLNVPPGGMVKFAQKTQGGAAGGTHRPYIIVRLNGDATGGNTASVLTSVAA
jgi:hypothetical protein